MSDTRHTPGGRPPQKSGPRLVIPEPQRGAQPVPVTSDRTRRLLYHAAAYAAYALLGVALVLAVVLVMKRGRDEPPAPSEHVAWIRDSLSMAAAECRVRPPPQFELFVERYLKDPRVLVCPSVVSEFDADYWPVANVPDARDMSYCYVNGLSTKDAHDYIVAFDGEWDHALGP